MRSSASIRLVVLALSLAACEGRFAPPDRDSPALTPATTETYAAIVRTRDGVTLLAASLRDPILRVDPGGALVEVWPPPSSGDAILGFDDFCPLGAQSLAVVRDGEAGTVVEIVGASGSQPTPLTDVVDFTPQYYGHLCAGTGPDDVWVLVNPEDSERPYALAHFDGAAWSAEDVSFGDRTSLDPWMAATASGLWIGDTRLAVYRTYGDATFGAPITAVGRAAATAGDRVLLVPAYEGSVATLLEGGASAGTLGPTALGGTLLADGTVRLLNVESEGESQTSLGGSSTVYYPHWAQVVVTDADGVELGHATRVVEEGEQASEALEAHGVAVGDDYLVLWNARLYDAP